jgi:hypothetical protein
MSANKTDKKPKVKVLYQNLGGTWYAFTSVGNDVYFSPVNLKQKASGSQKATTSTARKRTSTTKTKADKEAA